MSKCAGTWFGKTHLEFHLLKDLMCNKNSFCRYNSSKRKTKKNVGLLLNETDNMVTKTTENTEVPNLKISPYWQTCLQQFFVSETHGQVWSKEGSLLLEVS